MIIGIDDGYVEIKCDNCGAEFSWFSSNPNLRLMWCEDCKVDKINELEKVVEGSLKVEQAPVKGEVLGSSPAPPAKTPEVEGIKTEKKHKDVAGILRTYEKFCDYCGTRFATDIFERQHCCREHLENDIESEELEQEGIKSPRVSMEPEAVAKRSESQQLRRGLEKQRGTPKTDCVQCGKPTTRKLYCSDKCRKEYESILKVAAQEEPTITFKPIVPGMPEDGKADR